MVSIFGIAVGFDGLVTAVPAGGAAGIIAPQHMDFGAAVFFGDRIFIFLELVFHGGFDGAAAVIGDRTQLNGFMDQGFRNKLFTPGRYGGAGGFDQALAQDGIEEAGGLDALSAGHTAVGDLSLPLAGTAQTLHGQQNAFQSGRFMRIGTSDIRTAEIMGDGNGFLGPISGQGFDGPFGDAAFLGSPFRGLGYAVFIFTQDIVLHLFKTDGMGLNIFLIVGAFFDPGVDDGQLHGGIGIGQNGDPFIGMHGAAVVYIRADIDLFDADIMPEVAQAAEAN